MIFTPLSLMLYSLIYYINIAVDKNARDSYFILLHR